MILYRKNILIEHEIKPGLTLFQFSKLSLLEIINRLGDTYAQDYVASLRGPDEARYQNLKVLFNGFLRGGNYRGIDLTNWVIFTKSLCIEHSIGLLDLNEQIKRLKHSIEKCSFHYRTHIEEGLIALRSLGGEVEHVAILLGFLLTTLPVHVDFWDDSLKQLINFVIDTGI
jgi:hypothetical protein